MRIDIASKREPFARRGRTEDGRPSTISNPGSDRDLFGGWGPKV